MVAIWTGKACDGRFDNPKNWDGGVAPTNPDAIEVEPLSAEADYMGAPACTWPTPFDVSQVLPGINPDDPDGENCSEWVLGFACGAWWPFLYYHETNRWVPCDEEVAMPVTHWLPMPPSPK